MKELFSSLSATVFYPLVSLVLRGLTAISGWFVFFAHRPPLRDLVHKNHTETALVLMLIAIFVGTVIDDLGVGGTRKCCQSMSEQGAICAIWARMADQIGALQMKILSHYASRQKRCIVAAVFEAKKEIPA